MKHVISLGGSVLGTTKEHLEYLKEFIVIIHSYADKGNQFVIFCGGGDIARTYIEYGKRYNLNNTSLDWIGIYATRLHALMLKNLFKKDVAGQIIIDPTKKIIFRKPIVIAAGWKPGWSTDFDAVLVAKNIKANSVINITNISHVYTKDPRKFKDGKKIETIPWKDFRKLVGDTWTPGLNMPFDPIASKEAEKSHIKVKIINNDITKLKACLDGKKFNGTLIY